MIRICTALCVSMALVSSAAIAAEKKKAEPAQPTLEKIVTDVVTAPVKLVDDLLKPLAPTPAKK